MADPRMKAPKVSDEDIHRASRWLEGTHAPHQGWTTEMQIALAKELSASRLAERAAILTRLRKMADEMNRAFMSDAIMQDTLRAAANEIESGDV